VSLKGRINQANMSVVRKEVEILNESGLHLRPAAMFVQTANKHKGCEIFVMHGSVRVNGKSIMGLVMLAAAKGTKLTIECVGEGCEEAAEELAQVVENKFGMESS
jgi:phosphocarrier protein